MVRPPQRPRTVAARAIPRRTARDVGTRRIRWLLGIYVLVVLLAVGQLVNLQVVNAEDYADRSLRQRARAVDLPATRGRIYDREGDVLATSVPGATVYADPRAYRPGRTPDGEPVPAAGDAHDVAAELAPLLDRDPDVLAERLERDAHFVYLARQLDWEVGERVHDLELPGVGVLTEPRRVYPAGGLAGQVVGFTGIDGEGLQGLESHFDQVLRGRPGMLAFEQAPGGLDIASGVREVVPSEPGTDLVLTLDREIQHAAERAASEAMEAHRARGASVLVMEVGTGEILAMASVPTFDPNRRDDEDRDTWRNRAVTDVFEPGSTQKAVTVAAALEEGIVTPESTFLVEDSLRVGGKRFTDAHPHPPEELSVGEIVERSSNVGTIQIAQELGEERLAEYLRAFGYGRQLGVGFPGESPGLLMPTDEWWATSLPTIAIGQGVAVSLLHLANGYATLANDGVAVQPRIVRGTVGDDGRLTPVATPGEERVVSADTARDVREMLVAAVSGERATGTRAQVTGYAVGGKTGTARKPNEDARGYSDQYVATFVGFAPADDPQLVVAVMLDEPRPVYGGLVAAPVFGDVMEIALTSRRIAPDTGGRTLEEALADAREAASDGAEREGPATRAEEPTSPPVGTPAGGDGGPAGDGAT